MFEKRKLKKYADLIIGFAYEQLGCAINTYLVINKGKLCFINYRTHYLSTASTADSLVEDLKSQGYKDLNYWFKNNQESKKLVKENTNNITKA